MHYTLIEILGYSIGVPALIGLFRIGRIDPAYFPFIILLWIGFLNEIVNTIIIDSGRSNAVNSNIYVLVESVLILCFFYTQGLFRRYKVLFYWMCIIFLGAWLIDNFIYSSIKRFNSYFRILYSFIIVLMSISLINRLLLEEKRKLLRNPLFLIMIGFIAFFTYKTLIEIFWVYGLNASKSFRVEVYRILTYINLTVNILFAIAVAWIPRKREYILP